MFNLTQTNSNDSNPRCEFLFTYFSYTTQCQSIVANVCNYVELVSYLAVVNIPNWFYLKNVYLSAIYLEIVHAHHQITLGEYGNISYFNT